MPTFLSPAWIDALDAAAAADPGLAELTADLDLVVEQRVTGTPTGDVIYHVRFDHGTTSVRSGAATDPTVRFTQDVGTAVEIAAGRESAQRAFMAGRLQVGGSVRALLDHGPVLASLGNTFATVPVEPDPSVVPVHGD